MDGSNTADTYPTKNYDLKIKILINAFLFQSTMRKPLRTINICSFYGQSSSDDFSQGIHVLLRNRKKTIGLKIVDMKDLESEILKHAESYNIRVVNQIMPLGYDEEMYFMEFKYSDGRTETLDHKLLQDPTSGRKFLKQLDYKWVESVKYSHSCVTVVLSKLPEEQIPEKIRTYMKHAA